MENALSNASEIADLEEIRGELEEQAYLKPRAGARKKQKGAAKTTAPFFCFNRRLYNLCG
ncbi:hypothetical protein N752_14750 [Desulforamulus aquiferis]|nr:hypothetical protein N752_14750 [Desulforamulus aquiferis]